MPKHYVHGMPYTTCDLSVTETYIIVLFEFFVVVILVLIEYVSASVSFSP